MVGTSLSGPWGDKGASFEAYFEYADTYAAQLFARTPLEGPLHSRKLYPGSMYNNVLYLDGFTYRGRPIGYWTDGDSHNLAVSFSLTDVRNRRWYASGNSVHLNITGISGIKTGPYGLYQGQSGNRISSDPEKFAIFTAGTEWPTKFGDVRLEGRYQTDSPSTPGRRVGRTAVEVGLRERF